MTRMDPSVNPSAALSATSLPTGSRSLGADLAVSDDRSFKKQINSSASNH